MTERIKVAIEGELAEGERKIVETEQGVSIGVFNIEGEYHALMNWCLHQNGPVCEGSVELELTGEPTDIGEWDEERYTDKRVVKCPWHGWEYYLETGKVVGADDMAIPSYEVEVEDGSVYVHP